jgi:hypothetical protein
MKSGKQPTVTDTQPNITKYTEIRKDFTKH